MAKAKQEKTENRKEVSKEEMIKYLQASIEYYGEKAKWWENLKNQVYCARDLLIRLDNTPSPNACETARTLIAVLDLMERYERRQQENESNILNDCTWKEKWVMLKDYISLHKKVWITTPAGNYAYDHVLKEMEFIEQHHKTSNQ